MLSWHRYLYSYKLLSFGGVPERDNVLMYDNEVETKVSKRSNKTKRQTRLKRNVSRQKCHGGAITMLPA